MLFSEALQMFQSHLEAHGRTPKTRYGYIRDVLGFQNHLESRVNLPVSPETVRPGDIENFVSYLNSTLKPVSVNRVLYALTSFFNCLQVFGFLSVNPARVVPRISTEKKERAFMTQVQLSEFLQGVDDYVARSVFYTLAYTGVRVSELTKLTVGNVQLHERRIVVHGKGRRERIIPIHDVLYRVLVDYVHREHHSRDAYQSFFRTHKTERVSPSTVNRWIAERVKELDWAFKVTAHTFRHTFGYMYIDEGGNVVELQKLLGHENLATTSIYAHTTHARLKGGVGRLPEF